MEDGVAGANVREKSVAETLTLAGALPQAGDVDHVQKSRDSAEKRNVQKKQVATRAVASGLSDLSGL